MCSFVHSDVTEGVIILPQNGMEAFSKSQQIKSTPQEKDEIWDDEASASPAPAAEGNANIRVGGFVESHSVRRSQVVKGMEESDDDSPR